MTSIGIIKTEQETLLSAQQLLGVEVSHFSKKEIRL